MKKNKKQNKNKNKTKQNWDDSHTRLTHLSPHSTHILTCSGETGNKYKSVRLVSDVISAVAGINNDQCVQHAANHEWKENLIDV